MSASGGGNTTGFGPIRDLARKQLVECLDQYSGSKMLVWDDALMGPMDLVANSQFLKERQVIKMGRLSSDSLDFMGGTGGDPSNVVFVSRPQVALMDRISNFVKRFESASAAASPTDRVEFHLLLVPRKSLLCEHRLKDKGVFGSFTFVDELNIHWFPLETDLLSMENSQVYRNFHLDGDPTSLHPVALAMLSLQALTGVIPTVYGKGRAAKQLWEYMSRMRKELAGTGKLPKSTPLIDSVVIIDRQIDLISPLVMQLTYEGLIDEMFGIRHSTVTMPASKFNTGEQERGEPEQEADELAASTGATNLKTIQLSSSEDMYADIRDKNFNAVGPCLSRKAKEVAAQYEERHDARTVKQLKEFVKNIPQLKAMKDSLSTHTSIAEMIKERTDRKIFLNTLHVQEDLLNFQGVDKPLDYLEDASCQEEDLLKVLRIMCLQSVVSSGLKPKVLEAYKRLLLHSYGHRHLLSLSNLEKLNLLSPQVSSRNYAVLRKQLQLTLDDVNEQDPADIAYVHTVYAPLSIRLVQKLCHPGWHSIRDVLDLLPGPTLEEAQPTGNSNYQSSQGSRRGKEKDKDAGETPVTNTLVLFVGGCTFAEISALRFLSERDGASTNYLVATTSIINGNSFLQSLLTEVHDAMET